MKRLLSLLLFFSPLLIAAQKVKNTSIVNEKFKSIQDTIAGKINRGEIPSFSVAVSQNGKIIWKQSFGWADKENKIKATPSTVYALASLSKSITSTALMILVEKGFINSDDPVQKYLGKSKLTYYRGEASQLKISQLDNMMAGIPHQYNYLYRGEEKKALEIGEQIKRYGIVVFPPGQVYNYSNFSPGIVEQIIKTVTGKNLQQFMKDFVFTPLGMKNSTVYRKNVLPGTIAKGYNKKGDLLMESEFFPKGGAGFYASASDLLSYGMFHLKDKGLKNIPILTESSIDLLHSQNDLPGYSKLYSNGWGILKMNNGYSSLLSDGAIDGTASSLLLLPEKDIAIACLINASAGSDMTDQLAFNIADILMPGYLKEFEKFAEMNAPIFTDNPFMMADSLIGTWEGKIKTYRDSVFVKMIFDKEGKIFVHIENQFETLVNNVTSNNGLIQGQCFGNLYLPETDGIPHYLELVLKPGNNEIYGSISAQSFNTKRPYFLIPAYIELKRKNN